MNFFDFIDIEKEELKKHFFFHIYKIFLEEAIFQKLSIYLRIFHDKFSHRVLTPFKYILYTISTLKIFLYIKKGIIKQYHHVETLGTIKFRA